MLLAGLLTISFLAPEATVCSLGMGLRPQMDSLVGNTFINTTGTAQGFIPVAPRGLSAAIKEIFNAITPMDSSEPPLPPVREREREREREERRFLGITDVFHQLTPPSETPRREREAANIIHKRYACQEWRSFCAPRQPAAGLVGCRQQSTCVLPAHLLTPVAARPGRLETRESLVFALWIFVELCMWSGEARQRSLARKCGLW